MGGWTRPSAAYSRIRRISDVYTVVKYFFFNPALLNNLNNLNACSQAYACLLCLIFDMGIPLDAALDGHPELFI